MSYLLCHRSHLPAGRGAMAWDSISHDWDDSSLPSGGRWEKSLVLCSCSLAQFSWKGALRVSPVLNPEYAQSWGSTSCAGPVLGPSIPPVPSPASAVTVTAACPCAQGRELSHSTHSHQQKVILNTDFSISTAIAKGIHHLKTSSSAPVHSGHTDTLPVPAGLYSSSSFGIRSPAVTEGSWEFVTVKSGCVSPSLSEFPSEESFQLPHELSRWAEVSPWVWWLHRGLLFNNPVPTWPDPGSASLQSGHTWEQFLILFFLLYTSPATPQLQHLHLLNFNKCANAAFLTSTAKGTFVCTMQS